MDHQHMTRPCVSSSTFGHIPPNETNTIEVTNNMSTSVQVTQSQNTIHPSSSKSTITIDNTNNTQSEIELPANPINTCLYNNLPGLVRLYHNETSNYMLEQYCRPVVDTFLSTEGNCKFHRNCIVSKLKLVNDGVNMRELSPTVYQKSMFSSKKSDYTKMDTRLVCCFNKLCKSTNVNLSKSFHYICYQNMIKKQSNLEMEVVEYSANKKNILHHIKEGIDMTQIEDTLKDKDPQLIFPICGKRCYNTVMKELIDKSSKGESEYSIVQSWDKDGDVDTETKSSIDILIEWLTTEENATKYFGGLDIDGKTSASRKEAYHHLIRDMIMKENGM